MIATAKLNVVSSILCILSALFIATLSGPARSAEQLGKKGDVYPFNCVADQYHPCPDVIDLKDMVIEKNKSNAGGQPHISIKMDAPPEPQSMNNNNVMAGATSKVSTKLKLVNTTYNNFYWRLGQAVGSTAYYWPSASSAYYIKSGKSAQVTISCTRNYYVYIGGSSTNGYSFCYGVNFDQTPSGTCSAVCNGGSYTLTVY